LTGNAGRLNQANTTSPTITSFQAANQQLQALQSQSRALESQIINGSAERAQLVEQVKALYTGQKAFVDSVTKQNPIVGKSLQLELMPPFIPGESPSPSAQIHYVSSFLSEVDLSDPDFAYMPLPDKVQEFTSNLTRMGFESTEVAEHLTKLTNKLPKGSITEKNVLARMVYALEMARHSSYPVIVEKYLKVAPTDPRAPTLRQNAQALAEKARREAEANARFAPGKTPPEIALKNPNGKTVKLSDLKGKVVMIDFWASWCGPCRRENPNVVKLYKKYANKGFEILGVSLDKDKKRWVDAIKQDKLDWLHVSDLKAWQSAAAQTYGVSAIPATFLLDKDGKMIAKGLRGAALEQKLEEIFGA
jgi:thiol-disulfide isomerase/thioredoxin